MLDTITITVKSGNGGDGCVAARREAGVPYGGPAGGDGGKGGDVVFKATRNEQTLSWFRYHTQIEAKDGEKGMIKDKYGANAADLLVLVPIGTIIKDTTSGKALFQFLKDEDEYLVAQGGRGGAGNIHFANPIQQYPNFALFGEPGQMYTITLELQMLGDVGLIGTPSVGKSSLINTCCATRAKTAEYHFTTLEPSIGICELASSSFSIVDIPGLISGASGGKGLGNDFLRHVLKAKVFALVADMSKYEESFDDLTTVIDEIFTYMYQRFVSSTEFGETITAIELKIKDFSDTTQSKQSYVVVSCIASSEQGERVLFDKAIHILANKYDMVNDPEIAQEYLQALCDHLANHLTQRRNLPVSGDMLFGNAFVVSAATHQGIKDWTQSVSHLIESTPLKTMTLLDVVDTKKREHPFVTEITAQEIPILLEEGYIEERTAKRIKVWEVWDKEITRLSFTIPRGNEQAEHWYRGIMSKQKHLENLMKAGVLSGDVLKIKTYYTAEQDKYIIFNI